MKTNRILQYGALLLPLTFSSCSLMGISTTGDLKRVEQTSYQRGHKAGRAAEVRHAYHQEQLEKERPTPPPPNRYYEVTVPAHTASDGVKIESHKLTLAVAQ